MRKTELHSEIRAAENRGAKTEGRGAEGRAARADSNNPKGRRAAPAAPPPADSIAAPDVARLGEGWLLDGEIAQHSPQTVAIRRFLLGKLSWFLSARGCGRCGTPELRQFLAYVTRGHLEPGGRWGNPRLTRPVRPSTVRTYWLHLCAFFNWLVAEGALESSPLRPIAAPAVRADQVTPFTPAQVEALLSAARRTLHPRRDEAILLVLLDTGLRASELCSALARDLDVEGRRLGVLGKGGKRRSVFFGRTCTKALWAYLREEPRAPDGPLFLSDRGGRAGDGLTRSGLGQLLERLGRAAGVEAVRVSPHTCRHTFALSFLRAGGNVFGLQTLLGHTDVKMTQRYVRLAEGDIERQHREHSPVDWLKGEGRK